jgi:tetratricopeptide (TPR) repeat protein
MDYFMNANSEELYLEAEADIKNNHYAEAFKKYESILYEEPDSAQAHNSMGWLYKTQFDDYAKAENHFHRHQMRSFISPFLLSYGRPADGYGTVRRTAAAPGKMSAGKDHRQIMGIWPLCVSEELRRNYEKAIYYFEKAILGQSE